MLSERSHSKGRRNSAATSPIELRQQIDFQFLNFSHPSEAKTTRTRKAVRSHVTKQQHQRENAAAAARRAARSQEELTLRQREPVVASASSSVGDVSRAETPEASPSPSISPINAPQRRLDPSEIYPEEWHPYIGRIMVRHPGTRWWRPKMNVTDWYVAGTLHHKPCCGYSRPRQSRRTRPASNTLFALRYV